MYLVLPLQKHLKAVKGIQLQEHIVGYATAWPSRPPHEVSTAAAGSAGWFPPERNEFPSGKGPPAKKNCVGFAVTKPSSELPGPEGKVPTCMREASTASGGFPPQGNEFLSNKGNPKRKNNVGYRQWPSLHWSCQGQKVKSPEASVGIQPHPAAFHQGMNVYQTKATRKEETISAIGSGQAFI